MSNEGRVNGDFGTHARRQQSQDDFEPSASLQRALTGIVHRPGQVWTIYRVARLVIIKLRIIRTFTINRKAYEHICDICNELELHQNKFLISHHSADRKHQAYTSLLSTDRSRSTTDPSSSLGSKRYELGALRDIQQRAELCPFCKLVIHSVGDWKARAGYSQKIKKCNEVIKRLQKGIVSLEGEVERALEELEEPAEDRERALRALSEPADAPNEWTRSEEATQNLAAELTEACAKIKLKNDEIGKIQEEIMTNKADIEKTEGEITHHEEAGRAAYEKIRNASCHANFQVDGREVERDESGKVVSSRPRTRRIQLKWTREDALDTSYVVFVAPEPGRGYDTDQRHLWESDTLFLARSIHGANKIQDRIKSWMDLCCDHHGKPCNVERGEAFRRLTSKAFFGVIDVAEMRLTALPPDSRYIALSYTWGQQTLYTTTLKNIQLHQEYGGLEKQFYRLPRVVRDAIQLVRSLGKRYLWVDSICIVQENDVSWNLNSSVMDLVYGHAHATICAAEGNGAQTGLRGLDPQRTTFQSIEECAKGLNLTVSHLAEAYIEKSVWNTRGWTFQERLLSRRCIIFVGERVFFQCRSTALSEDIIGEQENAGWSIDLVQAPLQMLLDIETKGFSVYAECVRLYSWRNLSKRRDILAAFRGMSNLIAKEIGAPLHFGLPTSHFDLALLWSPLSACQRREPVSETEREEFGSMKFPSWSWCGWSDAAIEYRSDVVEGCLANVSQWLNGHTWIRWYVRDGEGDLRPIWSDSQVLHRSYTDTDTRWLGYGNNPGRRADDYGRVLKKEYLEHDSKPLEHSRFTRTLSTYPFGIHEASESIGTTQKYPDQSYLQFWTWSAHLRVIRRSTDAGEGLVRCDIEDYSGDWCGTIVLNNQWIEKWYKEHEEEDSVHEFIAISEAKNFSRTENDMWTYYIPREREQAEWHLFYILLISKQGGIWYREGLGKVFKDAFAKSYLPGKEWKEIILG